MVIAYAALKRSISIFLNLYLSLCWLKEDCHSNFYFLPKKLRHLDNFCSLGFLVELFQVFVFHRSRGYFCKTKILQQGFLSLTGLIISSLTLISCKISSKTETFLSNIFSNYYKVPEFPQVAILC